MLESCEGILHHEVLQLFARSLPDPVPCIAAISDGYTRDVTDERDRLRDLPYCRA